jgi:hypothetical protein
VPAVARHCEVPSRRDRRCCFLDRKIRRSWSLIAAAARSRALAVVGPAGRFVSSERRESTLAVRPSPVTTLSDDQLVAHLACVARDERRATLNVVAALAEFDVRQLYLA